MNDADILKARTESPPVGRKSIFIRKDIFCNLEVDNNLISFENSVEIIYIYWLKTLNVIEGSFM